MRAVAKRCHSRHINDRSSTTSSSSQDLLQHQNEYEGDLEGDASPLQQPDRQHNEEPDGIKYVDEDFFAALDKIFDENLKYWDLCI